MRERMRHAWSAAALVFCGLMAAVAILPLLSVLYTVARRGLPALNWAFFTQLPKPVGEPNPGASCAIFGSLVLIALAAVLGVPAGLLGGIFLARAVRGKTAFWVRYAADVLSGVPSIVVGVVAYELVVVPMHGFSAFSGGLALALIMLPTVVRTTEEMIRLVPGTLYEAAVALGVPEWRATIAVLLRGARAGILTGIMLAVARVAGETAPLLFTSFNSTFWTHDLTKPMASLPVLIFNYAMSPYDSWHAQAWAAAFVLIALILVMSILTRLATRGRYQILQ